MISELRELSKGIDDAPYGVRNLGRKKLIDRHPDIESCRDAWTANPAIMPLVDKYIGSQGWNYTSFYAPTSLCCPSRTAFMRAQYAHNHNVTTVAAPYGGWEVFCQYGYNKVSMFS